MFNLSEMLEMCVIVSNSPAKIQARKEKIDENRKEILIIKKDR